MVENGNKTAETEISVEYCEQTPSENYDTIMTPAFPFRHTLQNLEKLCHISLINLVAKTVIEIDIIQMSHIFNHSEGCLKLMLRLKIFLY